MGLTIHYSLKTRGSDARARKLMHALHQTARDLPFKELGELMELAGDQCDFHQLDQNDPLRWLLIQAEASVEIVARRFVRGGQTYRTWCGVQPTHVLAFYAWPGEGCEAANFGLCQYPAVVLTSDGPIKTRLSGWHWGSFCKTHYSSDPRYGGVPHFLQCHLTVIAMLDRARELGCLERVSDEGNFWEKRDLHALACQVGSWNEMLAALAGNLKDGMDEGPLRVQSAISQYPDFERLEAAGLNKLPASFEQLASLIQSVGQPQSHRCDARLSARKQNPCRGQSL